jgi:hypothetical protein
MEILAGSDRALPCFFQDRLRGGLQNAESLCPALRLRGNLADTKAEWQGLVLPLALARKVGA